MYDGPYIELFARNTRPDWQSWGNEGQLPLLMKEQDSAEGFLL